MVRAGASTLDMGNKQGKQRKKSRATFDDTSDAGDAHDDYEDYALAMHHVKREVEQGGAASAKTVKPGYDTFCHPTQRILF